MAALLIGSQTSSKAKDDSPEKEILLTSQWINGRVNDLKYL